MTVSFWEKMDKRARVPEMQHDLLQSRGPLNDGVKLYSEEDNEINSICSHWDNENEYFTALLTHTFHQFF